MADQWTRYNDGSQNAPRLRVQHSMWSLIALPMNAPVEWTIDEKFACVREHGFEAVECWPDDETGAEVKAALDRHDLRLVCGHHPFSTEDTRQAVERAQRLGADFLFSQVAAADTPLADVVKIIIEGRKIAHDAGLHYWVETHRNTFTENLPQSLQLIDAIPDIRFTADLSHFVVVGEFYGWKEEGALEKMRPILERTSHGHARISNGQSSQVDVGDGSGETAQFFVQLWTTALRAWKLEAGAGDVFPFTSELGPPRYGITLPDGREFSDRWEQSLVMKKLIEQAWQEA